MNSMFRKLLLGACVGASLWAADARPARADEYWNRHWGWYDNTYRPYYYRRNYYNTPYYNSYNYGYGSPYYGSPNYYYGPGYSRPYYPYRGGGVQLGPLQFGWW